MDRQGVARWIEKQGSKWVEIRECDYYEMSERMQTAERERDSLKQQIVELDKSTDDLQFKVKAVERLVGVLEKKLVERDAALERAVAAQNSLNIQLDHMKDIWDERGDEIRTLKEQLAKANAELDLNTELMRKQNAAYSRNSFLRR